MNKKKSLLILLFLIFVITSFAQKINYKLRGGYNSSNVTINGHKLFNTELGPNGGMTIDIPLKKKFLCQTGLVYSHKGDCHNLYYTFGPLAGSRAGKVSEKLHYLTVPVLAGYALKDKWHLLVGPQMDYLLAGRIKEGDRAGSPDYYRKFDFSAVIETEYRLFKKFGIYGGYDYGISKFAKGTEFDANGNLTGYKNYGSNRTIFVGIFYQGEVLVK